MKPKPPARNPYLSQNELKALGRLMGALRPAKLAVVRNCEVFQAGVHRGHVYTAADLADMVRNFGLARGVVDNPLVVGHDDDQAFLSDSGLPAAGWVMRLYRRGDKLFADFGGIPRSIARLINGRAYAKVSAEVYDEPPEGAPPACKGKMLRRVALLGGDLPQIKTLSDLPLAEYSERPPVCRPWRLVGSVDCVKAADGRAVRVTRFAEGATMDRAALEAQLKNVGYSDATIAALAPLSDDDFAAFVLAALSDEAAEQSGNPPADTPAAQAEWPEGVTRDSAIADLVAAGEDQATLDAMSDDEILALWQEKVGGAAPMSETQTTTPRPLPAHAGRHPLITPRRFAELERRLSVAEAREKRLAAERNREAKATRQRTVEAYCERWAREGYVLPREVDKGAKVPNLYHRLMQADGVRVKKFGEASLTDFDSIVAEVEDRGPGFVRKFFSEKLGQPEAGSHLADVEAQAKKYAEARNGQQQKKRA